MPVTSGIFHDFNLDGDIFKSWSKDHAMISFLLQDLSIHGFISVLRSIFKYQ